MAELPRSRIVGTIARQEARIVLRNRWVLAYGAILAALSFAVAYFGLAVIEFTGFQSFERTAVSLLNLMLYLVPLGAMLMAVQSFRPEGGATDQLFAEPVAVSEIVIGKALGLMTAHVLATVLGLSFTGILIGSRIGFEGVGDYLTLLGFSILIGLVFISVAVLLSVVCRREVKAYAVILAAWFVAVILYDLLVIGVSFLLPEFWANRLNTAAVFLNPVDAARVATILSVSGREMFGAAGAKLSRDLGGISQAVLCLTGALVAWVLVPLAASIQLLKKQDF